MKNTKTPSAKPQDEFFQLLDKKEPLDKELCPYLEEHPTLGKVLKHPLVFNVPYFEQMNAYTNECFRHKKKYIEDCLQKSDWSGYLLMHERPYRLQAFADVVDELKNKEYWELLSWLWSDSENIWQNLRTWKHYLNSKRPEKQYFMDEDERQHLASLPEEITIYRGCRKGKNEHGLSYTLDEKKAKWFSTRLLRKEEKHLAVVKKLVINKSDVFAFLNGRSEQEIIIL